MCAVLGAWLYVSIIYSYGHKWSFFSGVSLGKTLSTSLFQEIANVMMRDQVQDVGSCGSGCCVEIDRDDGKTQTSLLHLDESVTPESDPCQIYTCTVRSRARAC